MTSTAHLDLGLGLTNTHVLVTGGTGAIGAVTVQAFLQSGAKVSVFDIKSSTDTTNATNATNESYREYKVDISDPQQLESAFSQAIAHFGVIQVCVALASKDLSYVTHHDSILEMPFSQWKSTFDVNVHGTFLTAKLWLAQIKEHATPATKNVSLVVIGSESGHFGELGNPDYAAGKSAVMYGLVQSLRKDLVVVHSNARVNVVAPGPVGTEQFKKECEANPEQFYLDCQATTALRRPVSLAGVAKSILFLASESWSGDITGQIINVDSGKNGKLLWPAS